MPDEPSPESSNGSAAHTSDPLLRRYLPDPGGTGVIPAAAFRPTESDNTGISVSFRDGFPNPVGRVLANTNRPTVEYCVCEFDLRGLEGLTVEPSPTLADPGHATIPEICPPYGELARRDKRRIRIKSWTVELSKSAKTIHCAGQEIEQPTPATGEPTDQ